MFERYTKPTNENINIMGFITDLAVGKEAEEQLVQTLSSTYPHFSDFQYNTSTDLQQLKKYDFTFTGNTGSYSVEVKHDVKSSTTGNFAFEYLYKNKPSGINSTEADFFAIKSGDQFYVFKTSELKKRLLETPHNWRKTDIINGTASIILVPIDEIKDMAQILPVTNLI